MSMKPPDRRRWSATLALALIPLVYVPPALADDMVSFATGGYASALRTMDMMHMIDTSHDGMVSKDEWTAFEEKAFAALDNDKSGLIDEKEFMSPVDPRTAFATAAYTSNLQTHEMFKKIDTDGDGTISKEEFLSFHRKVFEMLDRTKKGMVGPTDWIRKSG
jgi:hypothetical protein